MPSANSLDKVNAATNSVNYFRKNNKNRKKVGELFEDRNGNVVTLPRQQ